MEKSSDYRSGHFQFMLEESGGISEF